MKSASEANWTPLERVVRGLTLTPCQNGETLIAGPIQDQAALHGILAKIRDLDLHLLAVVCVDCGRA
jgi:hypothetical protein